MVVFTLTSFLWLSLSPTGFRARSSTQDSCCSSPICSPSFFRCCCCSLSRLAKFYVSFLSLSLFRSFLLPLSLPLPPSHIFRIWPGSSFCAYQCTISHSVISARLSVGSVHHLSTLLWCTHLVVFTLYSPLIHHGNFCLLQIFLMISIEIYSLLTMCVFFCLFYVPFILRSSPLPPACSGPPTVSFESQHTHRCTTFAMICSTFGYNHDLGYSGRCWKTDLDYRNIVWGTTLFTILCTTHTLLGGRCKGQV